MKKPITVLAPTGTLGYGFGAKALERGMSLGPDVIAVDAGSTDPGPHYLGSGDPLVSRFSMKKELTQLIKAGRKAKIPVIVGSAGGSGSKAHVDWTLDIVRSKNAGPYRITFDILFRDPARYRAVRDSGAVTRETVAAAYGVEPSEITSFFEVDMANAIKITLRRPRGQGSFGESDIYGCQQHVPLLGLAVPVA